MQYVNVGARLAQPDKDGSWRPKTKRELREAIEASENGIGITVFFDQTSEVHSGRVPGIAVLEDLKSLEVILSVCGPDPYTDRKWYASVKRLKNGRISFH
jgi:hypothetical protein